MDNVKLNQAFPRVLAVTGGKFYRMRLQILASVTAENFIRGDKTTP